MSTSVSVEIAHPRILAAVRRQVRIGQVGAAWKPALDKVWNFLRQNPGLRADGHNIFLYHHPTEREAPMDVDFGVEVSRTFEPQGEISLARTPAGKIVTAVHRGPYDRMRETHDAIQVWATANKMTFAGKSWEIYGDPTGNPSTIETRIAYLLA